MGARCIVLSACLVLFSCSKENPIAATRPTNVRLKATYSISVIDHENVVFGIYIDLGARRDDIDTVSISVYQSRPPTENGFYRLPYSTNYLIKNTQATIDSLIVIGNPDP